MNYYLDTEFHEYHKQPKVCGIKVGKAIPTVDLISIGIVSEDIQSKIGNAGTVNYKDREYYAVSKDFNVDDAWNSFQWSTVEGSITKPKVKEHWLRENVLKSIYEDFLQLDGLTIEESKKAVFSLRMFKFFLNKFGKTNKQISEEIHSFIYHEWLKDTGLSYPDKFDYENPIHNPKFYAYFADYDWVVFAQLYGKMMNLPKGYPWYCIDLKQTSDEIYEAKKASYYGNSKEEAIKNNHIFISKLSNHPDYPRQINEHNALDDAKWNKKLHEFLNNIK